MQETVVLRGGRHMTLPVDNLVVGDVVDVKFGDRIPADIRILHSAGFKVVSLRCCLDYLCMYIVYIYYTGRLQIHTTVFFAC